MLLGSIKCEAITETASKPSWIESIPGLSCRVSASIVVMQKYASKS